MRRGIPYHIETVFTAKKTQPNKRRDGARRNPLPRHPSHEQTSCDPTLPPSPKTNPRWTRGWTVDPEVLELVGLALASYRTRGWRFNVPLAGGLTFKIG